MTLVKNKNTNSQSHKKRYAHHHKKAASYKKTYWPYIPLYLFISSAVILSSKINSSTHALNIKNNYDYLTASGMNHVSFIQAVTKSSSTIMQASIVIALFIALAIFSIRSFKMVRSVVTYGGNLVRHSIAFDIALAIFIGICIVFARTL